LGVSNCVIHSKKSDTENDKALELFRDGTIRAAINNNSLTTGMDIPDIDLIIMLRPTRSTNLWVQMLGRGTRPVYASGFDLSTIEGRVLAIEYGGKPYCLVLDFASNSDVLGPINDPVLPRKKGDKAGTAPIKTCQWCGTYVHPSVKICPTCGEEFHSIVKIQTSASEIELIKQNVADLAKYENFYINHITFGVHHKLGAKDSIKVTYFSGKRNFTEYLCVEHAQDPVTCNNAEQWARGRFEKWWRKRTDLLCPVKIDDTLRLLDHIEHPTHVKVHINKKYPEIVDYCFDGSCFGTSSRVEIAPSIDIGSTSNIDVRKILKDLKSSLK
ncbi:MAG: helicase-related protein, partial [Pseudobdellovibrio sp.]